jgi:hypothetical protein
MINEWWIGGDVEGSGRVLFQSIMQATHLRDGRRHE